MNRSRRAKALSVACGVSVAALALAACGGSDDDGSTAAATGASTAAANASGGEAVNVAHFGAQVASPFVTAAHEAIKEQVAEMGGGKVELFDGANDPQKQLQQCQDAIATQRFKVFLLQPVDGSAAMSCAKDAIDAGIAVVALGSPIGPDPDTVEPQVEGIAGTTIESPSTYGGGLADLTVKACADKDPCNVIYQFGPPTFSFIANSRKAFQDQIKEHPNIKVVAEGSHGFVPDKAVALTKQQLQAHPDTDVITSDDDATAVAIVKTVDQLGKQDQVTTIGGGGAKEAIDLIVAGDLFGTTVLLPRSEAKKAAEIGIKVARGEDPGKTGIDSAHDLSPIGTTATKDNADGFEAEWSVSG